MNSLLNLNITWGHGLKKPYGGMLAPDFPEKVVNTTLGQALQYLEIKVKEGFPIEISLLFCNDKKINQLNKEFRNKDYATNVLSFPNFMKLDKHIFLKEMEDRSSIYIGDIAISLPTIERESVEQGKTFVSHLTHMIVHGILHLLGFDHEMETEAQAMESLEARILEGFNIANPYA